MKVSILTACFNNANFLDDCIKSVISQSYGDFEWIIVDDCSSDGSIDRLHSIKDKRVKVLRNTKRSFCSSSYAIALRHSTGSICGILDADDMLVNSAIKTIVELYTKYSNIGYIYTQHHWCDRNMKIIRKGLSSMPIKRMSFVESALLSKKHCFSHWRTFRKCLSEKSVIFPEGLSYAVDKNMGFVLEEISSGGFYNHCLYYYRYHKANMSLKFPGKQKETWVSLAKQFREKRNKQALKIYPVIEIK